MSTRSEYARYQITRYMQDSLEKGILEPRYNKSLNLSQWRGVSIIVETSRRYGLITINSGYTIFYHSVDKSQSDKFKELGIELITENNQVFYVCDWKREVLGVIVQNNLQLESDLEREKISHCGCDTDATKLVFRFVTVQPQVTLTQGIVLPYPMPDTIRTTFQITEEKTSAARNTFKALREQALYQDHTRNDYKDYNFEEKDLDEED